MSMNDLVSDFVARVNNAITAEQDSVSVLKNNIVVNTTKKLVKLGYFHSFEDGEREITIELNPSKIKKLTRMSKPGRRLYVSYVKFPRVMSGIGWNIISTSKGIMTNFEAKNNKVGGELMFQIV